MTRKNLAVVLVLCLLLACFSACQSEQDEIYSQAVEDQKSAVSAAPTAEPGDGEASEMPQSEDRLAGELTIRVGVLRDMYRINSLSMEFMKLHPGVNVTIDADYSITQWSGLSSAEKRMNQESFRSQLRTEIASGEADYLIFDFTDELDLTPLSQVGALSDMSEFWENDPDLQEDDLFMPVIEAFRVEGKMTAIPYAFLFPAVTFSQHVIDDAGINLTGVHTVGVTQLLDWYDRARGSKPDLNLFFTSPGKDALFSTEKVDYIDVSSATSSFQSSEFVDFLERTNGVGNNEPDLSEDLIGYGYGSPGLARYWEEYRETGKIPLEVSMSLDAGFPQLDLVTRKAKEWFAVASAESLYTFYTVQDPLPYLTQPYPLISSDGKLGISSYEDFAMPESLQNKDLAWEFIKYCLSVREDPTFYELTGFRWPYVSQGFPLNKENYRKMVEYIAAGNAYGTSLIGYPGNYKGIDPEALLAELDEILTCDPVNVNAYNVNVQEYLDEFYVNGLITAEECAKKIQDRTYMWLME